MRLRRSAFALGAIAVTAGLALTGCTGGGGGGADAAPEEIEILGAFGGDQAAGFQAELDAWGEESGITATYVSSDDFNTAIVARVTGGDAPDIAIYPQPGILLQQTANMTPLEDLVDVGAIESTLVPGWSDLAVSDGTVYGLPVGANVKSLVWYNPAAFEANGYAVPTTDEEMMALTDQIREDGTGFPWCMGIESGAATGWPATDWLEEYVLRYGGIDTYNQWWRHEIPFNDPVVVEAAEKFEEIALTPGNVNGGGQAIALENFGTAGNGLFVEGGTAAGQCFMMRQGSFITDFFPDEIQEQLAAGDYTNVNIFGLPAPEGATDGVLGGGDIAAAFGDDESTAAVMEFILSDQLGTNGWAETGFFLSPHATFDPSLYPNELQQQIGTILSEAEVFGFDASDLMPGAVGSGSMWSELTEWISGSKSLDDALNAIEASWPAS